MIKSGFIGGDIGYGLLRHFGRQALAENYQVNGASYDGISKLEKLLGKDVWREVQGKVVIDYGCGPGKEAIDMARHGARHVIGIDTWEKALRLARENAEKAGVSHLCEFTNASSQQILSFHSMPSNTTTIPAISCSTCTQC